MKNAVRFLAYLGFAVLTVFAGCKLLPTQGSQPDSLRIGAGEIAITPPIGYRMARYDDKRLASTQARLRPVRAKSQ